MNAFPSLVIVLLVPLCLATPPPSFPLHRRQDAGIVAPTVLPSINAKFQVAVEARQLVDPSRLETFGSAPNASRAIMVSAFYPVQAQGQGTSAADCTVPYMPPATTTFEDQDFADFGWRFDSLRLPVCNGSTAPPVIDNAPVVVLSTALNSSRLTYGAMAESIANQGYIVVTIDHPFDAPIVEFPDGKIITSIEMDSDVASENKIDEDVRVRAQDMIFVIDQLHAGTFSLGRASTDGQGSPVNVDHVVTVGHSLGGAAAASAMAADARVKGALNLDGEFIGPPADQGLNGSVLIFASNGTDNNTQALWQSTFPKLSGYKREIQLIPSQHSTLSDLPLLGHVLGTNNTLAARDSNSVAVSEIGTLDGLRVQSILQTYMTAFINGTFQNQSSPLFDQPNSEFPEITILAQPQPPSATDEPDD